jgi:predicted alpha/beta-hydrolase family hydrolase
MASQAQAEAPLPGVRGLVFFGFPLHPAGKPAAARAAHLARVNVPMLFLQGTRDALAEMSQLAPVIAELGERATLVQAEQADHSFHVPARSGRSDADVLRELLDCTATWMQDLSARAGDRRRASNRRPSAGRLLRGGRTRRSERL